MGPGRGELALWLAVLRQAFRDGLQYTGKQRLQGEAYRWFKDNRRDFRWVCELTGLDPEAVRADFMRAYEIHHSKKRQIFPTPFSPQEHHDAQKYILNKRAYKDERS